MQLLAKAFGLFNANLDKVAARLSEVTHPGKYPQLWTTAQTVSAQAGDTPLTVTDRGFDYEVRNLALKAFNAETHEEITSGVKVKIKSGQSEWYKDGVDISFFKADGGLFVKERKPIYIRNKEPFVLIVSNRLNVEVLVEAMFYGFISEKEVKRQVN